MRVSAFATVLSMAFILGCGVETSSPEEIVLKSYRALDDEDIGAYLSTVSGPRADVAGSLLIELFEDYDVSYTMDTIELLSEVSDVAMVRTVVMARDEGGPKKYHDNRMVAYHKLKYDNNRWTIYFSEIDRPQILNREGKNVQETIAADTSITRQGNSIDTTR